MRPTRVLFVDDEPLMLAAISRMLLPMKNELEAEFARSAEEAVPMLGERRFDVLVSDMRMPGMDGAALLEHAHRRYPATARVVLSGFAQYEAALRALSVSHRFIAKPFSPEELRAVLLRVSGLSRMLNSPALQEMVGRVKDLPARPVIYFQLRARLADENGSLHEIANLIERDAGITGRLLRAVNNAFFAPPARITRVEQAVQLLGLELLAGLVLTLECFGTFGAALLEHSLVPASLERKAYLAATLASRLLTDDEARSDAFLAALMHDCGLLLLADRDPELLARALSLSADEGISLHDAEQRLCGASHADLGAYLLGMWGLPYTVVEAIARQRRPEQLTASTVDTSAAVYLAIALAEAAMAGDVATVALDPDFMARVGLRGKLPELIALVEQTIAQSGDDPSDDAACVH